MSRTELASALARRRREGALTPPRFAEAKRRLSGLEGAWSEVAAIDAVRARARRLLEVHPLSAAAALHLARARRGTRTQGVGFVTFGEPLSEAAAREGFEILSE